MRRYGLRDDQWDRLKNLLPGREGHVVGTAEDNRLFVEAVLYRFKTGCPWRDLPERFGCWKTIHQRFSRWALGPTRDRPMACAPFFLPTGAVLMLAREITGLLESAWHSIPRNRQCRHVGPGDRLSCAGDRSRPDRHRPGGPRSPRRPSTVAARAEEAYRMLEAFFAKVHLIKALVAATLLVDAKRSGPVCRPYRTSPSLARGGALGQIVSVKAQALERAARRFADIPLQRNGNGGTP
jgi:transposase